MRKLYVLYDSVAKLAGPVFECRTDEQAQRQCSLLKAPKGTRANDFELVRIGELGDSGVITSTETKMLGTYPAEDVNE